MSRRDKCPVALLAVLLVTVIPASAATLSLERSGPDTLDLHLGQDPAYYFYLQQSTDLGNFTAFSMVLGDTPRTWSLYYDPETPSRFFRATAIDIHAPNDTDGDGIDDLYEIRHPVLNPLDPYDAVLDPDNNGQSYLEEYLLEYNLGDGKREAISDEVSLFTTRPFTGPAYEALSEEVSVFTTRPFAGPAVEALSEEVSVFTTRPFSGPAVEAMSEEVSIFTTRPFTGPAYEAISDEVSLQKFLPPP